MLFILAIAAAAIEPTGWVEFDRRAAGTAESPYEYDAGSIRREGAWLRVVYRYKFLLSGLPDPRYRVGIEINCGRHRARVYEHLSYSGLDPHGVRPFRAQVPTIATRIAPGSVEESLARRLCPGP